jgi:putative transposase
MSVTAVNTLFQALVVIFAAATDRVLARHIACLKTENRILRGKLPKRLTVTAAERRRLLQVGQPLGGAIKELITIVSPRTFARWLSGAAKAPQAARPAQPGRPRTPEDVRELVLRLARENAWGYTRIVGELKKLGVRKVSRSTVIKILKENGFEPGPKRGEGTWDDFLKRHLDTLWACDFFTKRVWTLGGLVDVFVLFFIHLGTRRVHVAGLTAHPDRPWMVQQARNLAMFFDDQPVKPKYLLRDRDSKFVKEFDDILRSEGIEVVQTGVRAPNQNAIAERFVGSVKRECLDHFVVFGEDHLRHLLREFLAHYHDCRPHQGLGNVPLNGLPPSADRPLSLAEVRCEQRLGGVLKHYSRAA